MSRRPGVFFVKGFRGYYRGKNAVRITTYAFDSHNCECEQTSRLFRTRDLKNDRRRRGAVPTTGSGLRSHVREDKKRPWVNCARSF